MEQHVIDIKGIDFSKETHELVGSLKAECCNGSWSFSWSSKDAKATEIHEKMRGWYDTLKYQPNTWFNIDDYIVRVVQCGGEGQTFFFKSMHGDS